MLSLRQTNGITGLARTDTNNNGVTITNWCVFSSRLDGRHDLKVKIALWEGTFLWNSVTMIPLATRRFASFTEKGLVCDFHSIENVINISSNHLSMASLTNRLSAAEAANETACQIIKEHRIWRDN
jgi:hypothetical protein